MSNPATAAVASAARVRWDLAIPARVGRRRPARSQRHAVDDFPDKDWHSMSLPPLSNPRAGELPLSRYALDRDYLARARPSLFEDLAADPATRFLLLWHGKGLLADEEGTRLALLEVDAVPPSGTVAVPGALRLGHRARTRRHPHRRRGARRRQRGIRHRRRTTLGQPAHHRQHPERPGRRDAHRGVGAGELAQLPPVLPAHRPAAAAGARRAGCDAARTTSWRSFPAPTRRSSCSSPTPTTACCSARTRCGRATGTRCWPDSSSRGSRSRRPSCGRSFEESGITVVNPRVRRLPAVAVPGIAHGRLPARSPTPQAAGHRRRTAAEILDLRWFTRERTAGCDRRDHPAGRRRRSRGS